MKEIEILKNNIIKYSPKEENTIERNRRNKKLNISDWRKFFKNKVHNIKV